MLLKLLQPYYFLAILCLVFDLSSQNGMAQDNVAQSASETCNFALPPEMPGVNYYVNPGGRGDTVDPMMFQLNSELLQGIQNFILAASNSLDRPVSWYRGPNLSAECVRDILSRAAADGALLVPPKNSGGRVQRVLYTVGLNLLAAKLAYRGLPVSDEVLMWLEQLTSAIVNDYRSFRFHGYFNNINAWSGAAAAIHLAVVENRLPKNTGLENFEAQNWIDSLNGISSESTSRGLIPSEMTRGRNSLSYSLYYANALFLHREARRALRYPDTRAEWVKLRAFTKKFGSIYCGSAADFFRQANAPLSLAEEASLKNSLATYGFRVVNVLMEGTLKKELYRTCTNLVTPSSYIDYPLGGDTRYIKAVLHRR